MQVFMPIHIKRETHKMISFTIAGNRKMMSRKEDNVLKWPVGYKTTHLKKKKKLVNCPNNFDFYFKNKYGRKKLFLKTHWSQTIKIEITKKPEKKGIYVEKKIGIELIK